MGRRRRDKKKKQGRRTRKKAESNISQEGSNDAPSSVEVAVDLPSEPEGQKISRREAMQKLGLLGLGLLPLSYLGKHLRLNRNTYGFLTRELPDPGYLSTRPFPTYVPVTGEFDGSHNSFLLKDKSTNAEIEMKLRGMGIPLDRIRSEVTKQIYVQPDDPEIVAEVIDHSKSALELLYATLSRITPLDLTWTPVKSGEDYSQDFHQRVMVGRYFGTVERFRTWELGNEDRPKLIKRVLADWNAGACVARSKDQWGIVLSCNRSALHTIYSETIPVYTTQACRSYRENHGFVEGAQASEAISEGISYVLARELIKRNDIPNGENYIRESIEEKRKNSPNMNNRYAYVEPAIKWVQKHGVQTAFDLYHGKSKEIHGCN